jgi:hypothetical protein
MLPLVPNRHKAPTDVTILFALGFGGSGSRALREQRGTDLLSFIILNEHRCSLRRSSRVAPIAVDEYQRDRACRQKPDGTGELLRSVDTRLRKQSG